MNEAEFYRTMRFIIAILMVFVMYCLISEKFNDYQQAKGIAISNYLSAQQNIDIPPSQAMYMEVNLNQYDIQIQDLDIFGSWNND